MIEPSHALPGIETGFLKEVDNLMLLVDTAIRDLRLNVHAITTRFEDLLPAYLSDDEKRTITGIAERYLRRTTRDLPTDLRTDSTPPAVGWNKSIRPEDIDNRNWAWQYEQRVVADLLLRKLPYGPLFAEYRTLEGWVEANPDVSKRRFAAFQEGLQEMARGAILKLAMSTWKDVYDVFKISEDPEYLTQLCAKVAARRRGWDKAEPHVLRTLLGMNDIPVSVYEFLTGWEVDAREKEYKNIVEAVVARTEAQQPVETTTPAASQQAEQLAPRVRGQGVDLRAQLYEDDPPAGQRQQTSAVTVDPDGIGAAIDAAARGETVRGTIIEPARVQPVVFENLTIYNPDGTSFRTYPRVVLDGQTSNTSKTQAGWIQHYAGTPRQLPSFPLLYAMIEDLVRTGNPAKEGLLADLRAYWIATSTQPTYGRDVMIHDVGREPFELSCSFPERSWWTRDLDEDGQQTLKALLMPRDLNQAQQIIQTFSNVPAYLWVPDQKGRQDIPNRAAFASVYRVRFGLVCGNRPVDVGRSRGVAFEGVTEHAR